MSAPRKIWAPHHVGSRGPYYPSAADAEEDYGGTAQAYHHDDVVRELRDQLAEMTRRRDEWRAKAEGYDDLRAAVRKGIAGAGDRNLSRVFLRGAMVELQAQVADLTHALQVINGMPPFKPLIEAQRVSDAALAKIAQEG